MESNITNQPYFDGASPLAEPHFDEEATLLSARPVVPLQKIKAKERSGKRLIFAVAMAGSLLVGALGATLIYKQRGRKQATAIVSTAVPGAAGMAVDETVAPAIAEKFGSAASATLPKNGPGSVDKKSVPWVSRSAAASVVETKRRKALASTDRWKRTVSS